MADGSSDLALVEPAALRARIETFLADPSFSADTRRTYRTGLERFASWIQGKTFASPREALVAFVKYLQVDAGRETRYAGGSDSARSGVLSAPYALPPASGSGGLRTNTVRLYQAAVTSFLAYHGVVVGRIKNARRTRGHLKDPFTPEEVRKMIDAWSGDSPAAVRNRAIIALLATTGLRQVEAWRADETDLRVRDGVHTLIIQGKGETEKNNFVVIGPEAWAYLKEWLKMRERILTKRLNSPAPVPSPSSSGIANPKSGIASSRTPSPALFLTCGRRTLAQRMTRIAIRKVIETAISRAGLKNGGRRLSGHSLRHTFVTTYLEGGGDMWKAQAAARHRSPETTQVYQDSVDRLKDAPEVAVSRMILSSPNTKKRQ